MDNLSKHIIGIISQTTGIDSHEIAIDHHIYLDLNASSEEVHLIKQQLEDDFMIELPDMDQDETTVKTLINAVEDAIL